MRSGIVRGIAAAGLVVLASCSHDRQAQAPTAQPARSPQEQSQEALRRAADAQKKASDQEKRAQAAHQDVQRAQQEAQQAQRKLAEAQQKEQQELAKTQQLQLEANQETQRAAQQVQQGQQAAARGLAQPFARGGQTMSGQVAQATADELVLRTQGGPPVTFKVDDRTSVRIDGRQASTTEIQEGAEARVAYDSSSPQPTAISIEVRSAATR